VCVCVCVSVSVCKRAIESNAGPDGCPRADEDCPFAHGASGAGPAQPCE
jgi:hypothetical protein